jgi:transposase
MGVHVARRNKKRKRRNFTPEYKAEVVELIRTSDKSIGEVARDLDLTETAVREWVKKAEVAETAASADKIEDVHAELRAARKRIKELEMERAILKKAAAFFAKESS